MAKGCLGWLGIALSQIESGCLVPGLVFGQARVYIEGCGVSGSGCFLNRPDFLRGWLGGPASCLAARLAGYSARGGGSCESVPRVAL